MSDSSQRYRLRLATGQTGQRIVLLDDEPISKSDISDAAVEIIVRTSYGRQLLGSLQFHEIAGVQKSIKFLFEDSTSNLVRRLTILLEGPTIELFVSLDAMNWNKPWSPLKYVRTIKEECFRRRSSLLVLDDFIADDGYRVISPVHDSRVNVGDEMERKIKEIEAISIHTDRLLTQASDNSAIRMYFDFPTDVRVACEQYLLYFVEFLRGFGVEARSELREVADQVLFSVSPIDERDALEKIQKALELYLKIPMASTDNVSTDIADYRIQQLIANVQHLKGQLALAGSILQLKQATIEQQQTTIQQQRQYLSGSILADSHRTAAPPDEEPLLGGTVSLTRYEGSGFTINLPDIYRRLRALFARD
ncbi:MAG TPA: hypothetical protein VFE05_09645 [Longimicrobiaceae bacterium]|jgi:hypothetical protein|nr:hypothetical protein [Longimicrobiaceae bacterium]